MLPLEMPLPFSFSEPFSLPSELVSLSPFSSSEPFESPFPLLMEMSQSLEGVERMELRMEELVGRLA